MNFITWPIFFNFLSKHHLFQMYGKSIWKPQYQKLNYCIISIIKTSYVKLNILYEVSVIVTWTISNEYEICVSEAATEISRAMKLFVSAFLTTNWVTEQSKIINKKKQFEFVIFELRHINGILSNTWCQSRVKIWFFLLVGLVGWFLWKTWSYA